jgi:hypothetical protein
MDLLRAKLLRRVYRRISQKKYIFFNVIVDRKTFEDNLSRCVKLFRENGGVYRRKTTGRTVAVIETVREIMQNAPHTSIRQLSQRNRVNLV